MSTIAHTRSHAVTHAWRGVVFGLLAGIRRRLWQVLVAGIAW